MKIILLTIAAIVGTANLAAASDSLRSGSSVVIEDPLPTANDLDGVEDIMVTMLRGAIENEDPEQQFGSELWDDLKKKLCFEIEKNEVEDDEEEKTLVGAGGKLLLLFKLKKVLCGDGITTSTTSTTTTTCGGQGDACTPIGTYSGSCCTSMFVFVLFTED